jgi:hypothetical protein
MKMDHDNLRMSYTGKLPERIWKLYEKQTTIQKAVEWDERPRMRPAILGSSPTSPTSSPPLPDPPVLAQNYASTPFPG